MFKDLESLSPSGFFEIKASVPHVSHQKGRLFFLPDTSGLLGEKSFADVSLYWKEEGVQVIVKAKRGVEEVYYPNYSDGDSVELFFDTRDLKTSKTVTQFCHHFVFLPEEVHGVGAVEITRFRGDLSHPIAPSELFVVQTEIKRSQYTMTIDIPKEALYGYAPKEFKRLGFDYRINRHKSSPQHFACSSRFFSMEKHPDLWASLELEEPLKL